MSPIDDARPRARQRLLEEAEASRRSLTHDPWVSPHRGFHRDSAVPDAVLQRIIDAAVVMPQDGVVGGWAAAYLHGASYLDGRNQPVPLILPPTRQVHRPGIAMIRAELAPTDAVRRFGMPCTSGVRTAYDVLRLAPNLIEAVVAGDCMLHAGLTRRQILAAYADEHPRRRGIRQLRAAVPLLNAAAASPPESRLRMWCSEAGLSPMLVNVPVLDIYGNLLGIPDLLEPVSGLAIEYDGAYHRELRQHTADNLREERFESAGLVVVRVTALDMRTKAATLARIARAYSRREDRDSSTDRWLVGDRSVGAA